MKFSKSLNQRFTLLYRRFLYRLAGTTVLLLTTRGRKTGRPHTVGLQYELINGKYYVGAADGERADWYRNLKSDPHVLVQAGRKVFQAAAETISDPERIADFMEYRLKKRPLMIRAILRMDGVVNKPDRAELLKYATKIRMVILSSIPAGKG